MAARASAIGFFALFVLALGADVARAQSADPAEIVVTGRRRAERLLDAPASATVRTGEELNAAGVVSVSSLMPRVPNVSLAGGIGGTLQGLSSIRGVSSLVRVVGVESGVGVYVDGVFMGRPDTFDQDLIGVERVEVLRGPHGTFFGRNAVAGVVNIVTYEPGERVRGEARADFGAYDLVRLQTYAAGPLTDHVAGSLAFNGVVRDGVVRHVSGGEDLDAIERGAFRGHLLLALHPAADLTLSVDGVVDRGRPAFFETADADFIDDATESTPFTTNHNQPNYLDRDVRGASMALRVRDRGGVWSLVTAYRDASFAAALDDDKLPVSFVEDEFADDTRLYSHEIRYASPAARRVRYVAGVSYFRQQVESFRPFAIGEFLTGMPGVSFPITLTSSADTEAYDVFANADISVTERLTLSAGARYTNERRESTFVQDDPIANLAPDIDFSGALRDHFFSPTLSAAYQVTNGPLIYGRYARGFKSAGFNTDFTQSGADLAVEPEIADNFELGLKQEFAQGRGIVTAALFSTDYEDLQVSQIVGNAVALRNAASARIWGLEAEGAYSNGQWTGAVSLGYLDATYGDFPDCPAPGGAPASTVVANCDGNRLVLAPRWTSSAMLERRFAAPSLGGDLFARGEMLYQSEIFFEPQNTRRLRGDPRTIINLRAGYRSADWETAVWVQNASDELYISYADDRSAISIPLTRAYGTPRTWGVSLRRTW